MKTITTDTVIQILKNLDRSLTLHSILLNHPVKDVISIFFTANNGDFIHRTIHFPDHNTSDRKLIPASPHFNPKPKSLNEIEK